MEINLDSVILNKSKAILIKKLVKFVISNNVGLLIDIYV